MADDIIEFINDVIPEESAGEQELRNYAAAHRVPILRSDAAALLRTLAALKQPDRILEIGTAIGYSAAILSGVLPNSHIDTVEINADAVIKARENFRKLNRSGQIRVIAGDGAEVMASLTQPYDMIFLDAAKGQYLTLYDDAMRLLRTGGLLVCDNCIFYGKITVNPEYAPHKHRTIITNMRAFLNKMMSDPRLQASLLNVGDGMAVACKIKETILP